MKILRAIVLTAILGSLLQASEATAQTGTQLELTPFVGGTFFLNDPPPQYALHRVGGGHLIIENSDWDDAFLVGMNAGIRWSERYSAEAMFSYMPTKLTPASGNVGLIDVNGFMYGVTFLYTFPLQGRWDPYLGAGIGGQTFDYDRVGIETDSHLAGIVIAGMSFELTERVGVRFDARDCFARLDSGVEGVDDEWEMDLMLSVGLNWQIPLGR